MGKIKTGVYGGVSGKLGNLVGGTWKGIDYLRVNAAPSNPRTDAQMQQRMKFSLVCDFIRPALGYVRVGFKNQAVRMSAYNAAFSYNIKHAIAGTYPDYTVDYEKALFSRGHLPMADNVTVTPAEGQFTFAWTDNSGISGASSTDVAYPLIYNQTKGCALYGTAVATRVDSMLQVDVPASWAGDVCALYLAFVAMDSDYVSDSLYLGEEMVG